MELHAWVVTIPIGKWNSYGCKQLRQKMPAALKKIGDEGYMNPEAYQTADYLANICAEIASRYYVDGIHLDYIRYPETWKQRVNRMEARDNITNIVRRIYGRIKAINPQIKVSCSPIGKYTNLSRYNSNGWDALNRVHQDAQGWLRMGIMDQLYPMMYFKGNNFYPFAINWKENSYGKDIVPGLGIYFLDPREGNWKIDDIKRQLYFLRSEGMGFCLFRAKYLLDNVKGIYDFLRTEYQYLEERGVRREERSSTPLLERCEGPEFLENDGRTMVLPEKGKVLDADVIAFVSMAGNVITTRPYRGKRADIRAIPDGIYTLRSVNKKGVTHRVGMVYIRR
ncbi:MAG: family 10 glycosylhydrolase, partial [Prevotella sp.]|nr:family 10 glycosylhydrolase [Prevotella sp.]